MKITVNDPMPGLRDAKTAEINRYFNTLAASNLHRDQAHAAKRLEAAAVAGGAAPSAEFQGEADLRGITVAELAALIALKPNSAAQRELQRQRTLVRVAAANTPAALANVDI